MAIRRLVVPSRIRTYRDWPNDLINGGIVRQVVRELMVRVGITGQFILRRRTGALIGCADDLSSRPKFLSEDTSHTDRDRSTSVR